MGDVINKFLLRTVNNKDESLLLKWANEPEVRQWSFNNNIISKQEHTFWFKKKLNDKNVIMWIFEYNNFPAGLVRIEKNNNKAILNYMICSEFRGKKLAVEMLKMATNELKKYWLNIKLRAFTLPGNVPSKKSLSKAGFILERSSNKKICYLLKIN